MLNFLKRLFSKQKQSLERVDKLRTDFKERYHHFKLLLNANNRALEIISEMDDALRGPRPFGMAFVRDRTARVSTNVFKIVKHLNLLAPDKYEILFDKFKEIQANINPTIQSIKSYPESPLVLPLSEIDNNMAEIVGGKMANLGEVRNRAGKTVPGGFVVSARAYREFIKFNDLQAEINRKIQTTKPNNLEERSDLSTSIQKLILAGEIPTDLSSAIIEHYQILQRRYSSKLLIAMRSSALGEDHIRTTFAGQYKTLLNVSDENILHSYKSIIASKYSLRAMSYRLNRGIRDEEVAICVGCLRMIEAISGGVLYSKNPINLDDDSIVINAAWGLPKIVVDGGADIDIFKIRRGEPLSIRRREIAHKSDQYTCDPAMGISLVDVPEIIRKSPSLTDEQILELSKIGLDLEAHFNKAQDIEWAIDTKGKITILQSRPLLRIAVLRDDNLETAETGNEIVLKGGITASPGVSCGPVFIVTRKDDVFKFPEGAILVTKQALPQWAMLLGRTAGVITEQGTMAGHLANASREFEVPAIFGINGATEILKPGQVVTVDAVTRRIYNGEVSELIKKYQKPHNPMQGSPIYESLKSAVKHISPLTLIDPDSTAFKPEKCETLHDITRFCHEKSVHEMFNFGRDHKFQERSSKQLYTDVAMKWWVLNLDDGFNQEVQGKFVKLTNITSIPMLALWQGITWKPWVGPPPIDGKGFMSVMFQATANTSLTIGTKSVYADRNYFMISRNFCSLASRLGFHFATVEALVSERSMENYISFQFKGGATDFDRRVKRLYFVREILEEHSFVVDIKEDLLIARLDNQEQKTMVEKLRVLGYMVIHTRQLDMVMSNPGTVSHYKKEITDDLVEMLGAEG